MRGRRWTFILLLTLLLLCKPATALAEGEDASIGDGVDVWMAQIDWGAFDALMQTMPQEVRALWSGVDARDMTERIALSGVDRIGEDWLDGKGFGALKRLAGAAAADCAAGAAALMGLALLGGIASALSAEQKDGVHGAAAFVCRCFMLSVVLATFAYAAGLAGDCMDRLCGCMEVAMPVLLTLLTALGGTASAGVLQPAMALLTGGVAASMRGIITPLVLCGGVLALFDALSETVQLREMSELVTSVRKWSVGIVTTLFTSVTLLRGLTAAAFDGVSVRTAKYAAGSMFPMVGGIVTGSFDTVLGCAGLVKNAAGLTTILLAASAAITPMLRIAVTMLLLRLTAAVIQPVAEKRQATMCRIGADMLSGLLSACAAITAMFLVTVGMAVALGNAGMS